LISYSYFLAVKKRKKAGNFPAFFCEPSGYFWEIFWTIVIKIKKRMIFILHKKPQQYQENIPIERQY